MLLGHSGTYLPYLQVTPKHYILLTICDIAIAMPEQFSLFDAIPSTEKKRHILYFDLETIRGADEVGGWGNIKNMGMACGVVYSTDSNQYHVYEESQVADLISILRSADLIIGFNHIRFDYEVLRGYSSFDFLKLKSFDMLIDLKDRLGHRIKLDSLAKSCLGESKSSDGLQSLKWVKEGRLDLVREYCQQDVKVTKNVFEFGQKNKFVHVEQLGEMKKIEIDWTLETIFRPLTT